MLGRSVSEISNDISQLENSEPLYPSITAELAKHYFELSQAQLHEGLPADALESCWHAYILNRYLPAAQFLGLSEEGDLNLEAQQISKPWRISEKNFTAGLQCLAGVGLERSYTKASYHIKIAALEEGHPEALYLLSWMYCEGRGVQKNIELSYEYCKQAVEKGMPKAITYLAWMYQIGNFVEIDLDYAEKLYKKAIIQHNCPVARTYLACFYLNDDTNRLRHQEASHYLHEAADLGYVLAQTILASMYEKGIVVNRNTIRAFELYRLASDQGDISSTIQLGLMYEDASNPTKASEYYQKAVNQNSAYAKYLLGSLYYLGNGVEKDVDKAMQYIRQSAQQGYSDAQFMLVRILYSENNLPKIDKEIIKNILLAAKKGDSSTLSYLERMIGKSDGYRVNFSEQSDFYREAYLLGVENAKAALSRLALHSDDSRVHYNNAIVSKSYEFLLSSPNQFYEEFSKDERLSEEERKFWVRRLLYNDRRKKHFLESNSSYSGRSRLKREYLDVCKFIYIDILLSSEVSSQAIWNSNKKLKGVIELLESISQDSGCYPRGQYLLLSIYGTLLRYSKSLNQYQRNLLEVKKCLSFWNVNFFDDDFFLMDKINAASFDESLCRNIRSFLLSWVEPFLSSYEALLFSFNKIGAMQLLREEARLFRDAIEGASDSVLIKCALEQVLQSSHLKTLESANEVLSLMEAAKAVYVQAQPESSNVEANVFQVQ